MKFHTIPSVERRQLKLVNWRWRFALLPMRLENSTSAIVIWLRWYETRGGHDCFFQEYRVDECTYLYEDSGEY